MKKFYVIFIIIALFLGGSILSEASLIHKYNKALGNLQQMQTLTSSRVDHLSNNLKVEKARNDIQQTELDTINSNF